MKVITTVTQKFQAFVKICLRCVIGVRWPENISNENLVAARTNHPWTCWQQGGTTVEWTNWLKFHETTSAHCTSGQSTLSTKLRNHGVLAFLWSIHLCWWISARQRICTRCLEPFPCVMMTENSWSFSVHLASLWWSSDCFIGCLSQERYIFILNHSNVALCFRCS